jgi:predicted pyridoxine 5'-phosphate oxidase superfamily flavin-nucleotide-binding protein
MLYGPPGFLQPIDDGLLLVASLPRAGDPLARNLSDTGQLGLLVIDLAARRRLRLNGRALLDPQRGIFLSIEQAYGNCPQYIRPREVHVDAGRGPGESVSSRTLKGRHQEWIRRADTFFIASAHPDGGADASHRGGTPGFVRVVDDRTLVFPDYPGNGMFNTLGNLAVQPEVGLQFPDFAHGRVLQITGRAAVDWAPGGSPERLITVSVDEVLETKSGGPMVGRVEEGQNDEAHRV